MRKQTNKPKSEFCDPEEKRCLPVHIGKEVKDVEETVHCSPCSNCDKRRKSTVC